MWCATCLYADAVICAHCGLVGWNPGLPLVSSPHPEARWTLEYLWCWASLEPMSMECWACLPKCTEWWWHTSWWGSPTGSWSSQDPPNRWEPRRPRTWHWCRLPEPPDHQNTPGSSEDRWLPLSWKSSSLPLGPGWIQAHWIHQVLRWEASLWYLDGDW